MARPKAAAIARSHHISGQPIVRIDGKDFYSGKHDSPESIARYAVLIGIYQQNDLRLPVYEYPMVSRLKRPTKWWPYCLVTSRRKSSLQIKPTRRCWFGTSPRYFVTCQEAIRQRTQGDRASESNLRCTGTARRRHQGQRLRPAGITAAAAAMD